MPSHSKRSKLALLAGVLLLCAWPVLAQEEAPFAPCSNCHEDAVRAFAKTPHGRGGGDGVATCGTCHENAAAHAESGDPADVKIPAGRSAEAACATCHDPGTAGGTRHHRRAGIGCADCHGIHMGQEKLLKSKATDLCGSCHKSELLSFQKPYSHRLEKGAMSCVSCHSAHDGSRDGSLLTGQLGQGPCADCHTDKAGPFVYSHVNGVVGDCQRCHQPHGSVNPKQLTRANVRQVCLECHSTPSAGAAGAQPPSFHDLRHPRYQNCTTCHPAVHGSMSSPALTK